MVAPTFASPNIGNYYVGRGFLSMKLEGDADYVDCGNCTMFEFQATPTLLNHFSSRQGVRTKDLVVVTELAATLRMSLEEFTARNMANYMLADQPAESGAFEIDMFTQPLLYAAVKFVGTNDVGPKWTFEFPQCTITPQSAISLISNGSGDWGKMDFQADVGKDPVTGKFCIATCPDFT
jgi:hypothetical protein